MQRFLFLFVVISGMVPSLLSGQGLLKKRNTINFVGKGERTTQLKYNKDFYGEEELTYVDVCDFSDGKDYVVMGWMKNAHAVYSSGFRCGHSRYVYLYFDSLNS